MMITTMSAMAGANIHANTVYRKTWQSTTSTSSSSALPSSPQPQHHNRKDRRRTCHIRNTRPHDRRHRQQQPTTTTIHPTLRLICASARFPKLGGTSVLCLSYAPCSRVEPRAYLFNIGAADYNTQAKQHREQGRAIVQAQAHHRGAGKRAEAQPQSNTRRHQRSGKQAPQQQGARNRWRQLRPQDEACLAAKSVPEGRLHMGPTSWAALHCNWHQHACQPALRRRRNHAIKKPRGCR